MATRSGGTPIRTKKVKPGPDQAFTLPKGTSAAPIMQVKVKPKSIPKKVKKDSTDLVGDIVIGGGSAGTAAIIAMMVKEKMQKEKKKKERTESRNKKRP